MQFINAWNQPYTPTNWLTYNDVLLMPRASDLESRNDPRISLAAKFTRKFDIKCPIISANMDTITEADMAIALGKMGGIGILHRFYKSDESFYKDVSRVFAELNGVAFSIGADDKNLDKIGTVLDITNKQNTVVCVDVAHGHLNKSLRQVRKIKEYFGSVIQIIAGNVATPAGCIDLINAGADAIKIGVGGGAMCSTRIQTGFGVPMLSTIMQCRMAINSTKTNVGLIADGGIKNSGDIVKALAAGADTVMIGHLLSGTNECSSTIYYKDGNNYIPCEFTEDYYKLPLYKKYRGQSSHDFLKDLGKINVSPEGESKYVETRGPVKNVLENLIGGIKSGMSYCGVTNLNDLNEQAIFLEISHHSYIEGTPHGITS